ncbi:MAG TPA: Spy/CpxP family protein refolding chaperone [Gemmatimonadaceae bacterium]|nr:Spy/CpxP family protein refolding chaperone [Gemmatimonadaceae bacterium]
MKLTRIAALVGMIALAAPAAYAQGGGASGGGQGRGMQMVMQGITLTDAQKASVDSIGQAFRSQMPPMQQGTPPDSAARAKRMEVMQKQYAAVRTVLTADQQKVYDKNLETMRANMNRPRPQ